MGYENIVEVREISTGSGYEDGTAPEAIAQVNIAFKADWKLLAIHQRTLKDIDGTERSATVYILGREKDYLLEALTKTEIVKPIDQTQGRAMDDQLWKELGSLNNQGYHIDFRHSVNVDHDRYKRLLELKGLGFAHWEENKDGSREWFAITEAGQKSLLEWEQNRPSR